MSYENILVIDEDDTPARDLMALPEFLGYIHQRLSDEKVKPEDVFVQISIKEYADEDNGGYLEIAQIEFLVKK